MKKIIKIIKISILMFFLLIQVSFSQYQEENSIQCPTQFRAVPAWIMSSVYDHKILWTGTTKEKYRDALFNGIVTWNALSKVLIEYTTSWWFDDLRIRDVDYEDEVYAVAWQRHPYFEDEIFINDFRMKVLNRNQKRHTLIHEFGHSLALKHSCLPNIMFEWGNSKTSLGEMDKACYNYNWNN